MLGTITVSATPGTISFTLAAGAQAQGSAPVAIYTAGQNLSGLSSVSLYAYFASTNALTDTAGDTLPNTALFGKDSSGTPTSYTAFTQSTPYSGSTGLLVYTTRDLVSLLSGRTDNLYLMIDLSSSPQLPAGTYNGTLFLEAQAF